MNFLTKITSISCQQAAKLSAKASFNALSIIERFKLKLHLKTCTCPTCHSFSQDTILIDEAIEKIIQQKERQSQTLSQEQRDRILEAIKN
jgi:hypothetical protein